MRPSWGLINSCLALGAVGGQVLAGRDQGASSPGADSRVLRASDELGRRLALGAGRVAGRWSRWLTVGSGAAFGLQAVIFPTAMQSAIAPEVLSRVAAIDLLGSEAGQPVGYALAGPIGQAVGAHAVLAAAAIGMLAGSVAFAFLPSLRTRIVPRAWQPDLPGAEFR